MSLGNRTSHLTGIEWNIATLALRQNRVALISQFNQVSGPHSQAIGRLQHDFIEENLDPAEMLNLAKVFQGVIDAAEKSTNKGGFS